MATDITLDDLPDLARGAALLGTGGGGDPYIGLLLVSEELRRGRTIRLLTTDEVDDDDLVVASAFMGAPTVVVEKIPSGDEPVTALRTLERRLGRAVDAIIPMECGGLNSMIPLLVAARAGIPIVDGDGMGRAFPELQMETFGVYGVSGSPIAICDSNGHTTVIDTGVDNKQMEWLARGVTIRMGGVSYIAEYPMTGAEVKRTAIPGTMSLALALGRCIREAREHHRDPFDALGQALERSIYGSGRVLLEGKVIDVERSSSDGFVRGTATVSTFDGDTAVTLTFQNEHLVAHHDGRVLAIVPDLISVLDAQTANPITTESLRYGQRVKIFAMSTPPIMRTPEALEVFGPQAFGLHDPWTPVEALAPV
ncbi:DUF917 domain-containing protein [Actinokineospora globicatena]|uniref:DUF917 domain-containing protein n=1 Tax=Actinokineospora globicatena TaxID=103729 RepID=UPI0020A402AC|nr:DUF917 domain-containing protein [Actinokineospora globicatena]MCP2303127.1 hypothetical protein [Actinokineospora globicatena]GLW79759.1 hypothetical protein Aglo01_42400 [Actinokineospora globicatena]GLW85831.1 hypothetical protein Aglo02_34710 [Actinokineospora globicatena]